MGKITKTAVILSAVPVGGEMRRYLTPDAFVVACDAGYRNAMRLGVQPDLIVGDFDSAPRSETTGKTIVLPHVKDDTDTHYAARWLLEQGVESLAARENALARLFYEQVRTAPGVTVYGDMTMQPRAPIVALNIGQEDSARVADILWEDYGICVRAGAHCAPLMHKALGTAEQGVVRFSFSHFNTEQEVQQAAQAVCALARELLCE